MGILNIQQIMEAKDITESEVEVEEWGGSVVVRSISHRDMRAIKIMVAGKGAVDADDVNEDDIEKWVLIKGLVDPTITEEEYEHLANKSFSAIQKILSAILGKSKTGDKAVTEAEKQFPAEPERVLPVPVGGETAQDGSRTSDRGEGAA